MARWKLTIRHGATVTREAFEDLGEAIASAGSHAEAIIAEGPRQTIRSLRDFEPAQQVVARVEISGKGLFRPPTAGVDVKGDGSLVAFRGGVRREVLDGGGAQPLEAVRRALED